VHQYKEQYNEEKQSFSTRTYFEHIVKMAGQLILNSHDTDHLEDAGNFNDFVDLAYAGDTCQLVYMADVP
jgi:hypothetical protein